MLPVGPDNAPTPTADAAGRAEDPTLLTSLSAKLDRCMGRIDYWKQSWEPQRKSWGSYFDTCISSKEVGKNEIYINLFLSRDVVVAGSVIQTVQAGLRESYECLASAPIIVLYNFGVCACTARQMVLSSPWLTANKESGSPLQTALIDMVINPPWNLPFLGAKGLTSPEQTATGKGISNPLMAVMVCQKPYGIHHTMYSSTEELKWGSQFTMDIHISGGQETTTPEVNGLMLLFFNVAACIVAAGYLVSAVVPADSSSSIPADNVPAGSSSSIPADYVSAGHTCDYISIIQPHRLEDLSSIC
ncbi:hypothetical protein Tco_1005406 [Tanacetum coccineum]|uniref:Uncharacterized protein n=1 Tax=Tanacetum coccineum TaxID=301880 RepID=A0ABQ5FF48_9ASTR